MGKLKSLWVDPPKDYPPSLIFLSEAGACPSEAPFVLHLIKQSPCLNFDEGKKCLSRLNSLI